MYRNSAFFKLPYIILNNYYFYCGAFINWWCRVLLCKENLSWIICLQFITVLIVLSLSLSSLSFLSILLFFYFLSWSYLPFHTSLFYFTLDLWLFKWRWLVFAASFLNKEILCQVQQIILRQSTNTILDTAYTFCTIFLRAMKCIQLIHKTTLKPYLLSIFFNSIKWSSFTLHHYVSLLVGQSAIGWCIHSLTIHSLHFFHLLTLLLF